MRPPSLVQFGPDHGEGCGHLLRPFSPFPYGPLRPNTNSRNSPVLRKIPESLGTFPKSEYSRPIYRFLRLDHFETPRHIPDPIRDSELLRYIKTHNIIVIETLSARTLRFENNVEMTETRLRSITNSGTWMPILAPTYSTKIFIGQTA